MSVWIGKHLTLALWGESHGDAIGGVLSGFPYGEDYPYDFIMEQLHKRMSKNDLTTTRGEKDVPIIDSGINHNKTAGSPIAVRFLNRDVHSASYSDVKAIPRPNHSDYTATLRFGGFSDYRGGGHFSGRLTAPLVFFGAMAEDYLSRHYNVGFHTKLHQVGGITNTTDDFISEDVKNRIKWAMDKGTSVGSTVSVQVTGYPGGLGSPIFDNVESRISSLLFSIPGVRAVEFGDGVLLGHMTGEEASDEWTYEGEDVKLRTHHQGGILGGITTGSELHIKVTFKPTASIATMQNTVNLNEQKNTAVKIQGRHDPCIGVRGAVVVESAISLVLLDLLLEAKGYEHR